MLFFMPDGSPISIANSFFDAKTVLLLGDNGVGKTTFLKQVFDQRHRIFPKQQTVLLIQDALSPLSGIRVGDLLQQFRVDLIEEECLYQQFYNLFDLGPLMAKKVRTLSGGEKQLIKLCMVLSYNTEVLLLDEPLNALDSKNSNNIVAFINMLKREHNKRIIMIEHKLEYLKSLSWPIFYMSYESEKRHILEKKKGR